MIPISAIAKPLSAPSSAPISIARAVPMPCAADHDIEIEPDDIDVSDSVTFVWEIE